MDEDDGGQPVVIAQPGRQVDVCLQPVVADASVLQVAADLHLVHPGDGQYD